MKMITIIIFTSALAISGCADLGSAVKGVGNAYSTNWEVLKMWGTNPELLKPDFSTPSQVQEKKMLDSAK